VGGSTIKNWPLFELDGSLLVIVTAKVYVVIAPVTMALVAGDDLVTAKAFAVRARLPCTTVAVSTLPLVAETDVEIVKVVVEIVLK
jgi:hypothetical protein